MVRYATARAAVIEATELTAPCLTVDLDVADPIPDIAGSSPSEEVRCMWALVRMQTEPVGILMMAVPPEGVRRHQLVDGLTQVFGPELRARSEAVGANWPRVDGDAPIETARPSIFLTSRQDVLSHGLPFTVVVCTREQPRGLERCLASLVRQSYPCFSILVVDNAPTTDCSQSVVARLRAGALPIDYVVEPRPGLAWARNRAIQTVREGILAWIDDDEVADEFWLAELARGFVEHSGVDAVSGIMLPAELRTSAQVWFEQYGGHHKHRGFDSITFSPRAGLRQSPLYPLPPFGTGGNMAFRREALVQLGGFDTALGAGTLSKGAEDTRAFTDLLLDGGTVVYQPTAVTHHFHRETRAELRRQMFGYGAGLTAYYTSLLLSRPGCARELIGLVPTFVRDMAGPASLRTGQLPSGFPSELRWANRWGMASGPFRYLGARIVARQEGRRRRRAG